MDKLMDVNLTDDEFLRMTRYCNTYDEFNHGYKRAKLMGLDSPGVVVGNGAIVRLSPGSKVEQNSLIGLNCYVNGKVTIEENVLIGPGCAITAGQHKFDPETGWFSARTEPDGDESIVIGKASWLCAHVTVTPGVKIGRANLICAGAVVTHSTPDYAIMAGVPARQKGHINPKTGEYHWYKNDEAN